MQVVTGERQRKTSAGGWGYVIKTKREKPVGAKVMIRGNRIRLKAFPKKRALRKK